jgi:hypothetical protein
MGNTDATTGLAITSWPKPGRTRYARQTGNPQPRRPGSTDSPPATATTGELTQAITGEERLTDPPDDRDHQ